MLELVAGKKIVFQWGSVDEGNVVTISLKETDRLSMIVEVNESGFNQNDVNLIDNMLGNKEGWVYVLTCLKGYLEYGVQLRAALVKD